jgi:hypothetical protein
VLAQVDLLPGELLALDELHHAHFLAVAQGANHHAEGRAGLAFAVAGQQQRHAALFVAAAMEASTVLFLFFHGRFVAGILLSSEVIAYSGVGGLTRGQKPGHFLVAFVQGIFQAQKALEILQDCEADVEVQ